MRSTSACASCGFIPTRVGNTVRSKTHARRGTVHPHARGEHEFEGIKTSVDYGSSPRAWGTRIIGYSVVYTYRFIPTRVGNTPGWPRFCFVGAVHPHARGEHLLPAAPTMLRCGSSPRAWGTLKHAYSRKSSIRFIPTRVGNTRAPWSWMGEFPVHPHARGEHVRFICYVADRRGSSPRAWGTHSISHQITTVTRFIPTRVGNTAARPRPGVAATVHPHARGEHFEAVGKFGGELRFIPTRVGNTGSEQTATPAAAVHPHARGEHIG